MKKVTLLIIDDWHDSKTNFQKVLEKRGYHIAGICTDSKEAGILINKKKPDLVFMDLDPGNAEDRLEKIRTVQDATTIPVIVTTGTEEGFYSIFTKPLNDKKLLETVEQVLTDLVPENNKEGAFSSGVLFEELFKQSPVAMVLCDTASGSIKNINPKGCLLFEIEKDRDGDCDTKLYDSIDITFFFPDATPVGPDMSPFTRAMRGEQFKQEEYYIIKKDGTKCWLWAQGVPVYINGGQPVAGLVVFNNISGMKMTNKAMQLTQFTVDRNADVVIWFLENGQLVYVNDSACELLGYTQKEFFDMSIFDIDVHVDEPGFPAMWNTVKKRKAYSFETVYKKKDRSSYPVEVTINYVKFDGREYQCAFARDITERKKNEDQIRRSLYEKEVYLKEIHHRVKNNLQIISSLIDLQEFNINSESDRAFLEETKSRIFAIALVHEKLYQTDNLSAINFRDYIESLVNELLMVYKGNENSISVTLSVDAEPIDIGIAIPCGLIINELLNNAIKHAFPGNSDGTIAITFKNEKDKYKLSVADNGIGMPKSLINTKTTSMGLNLVNILTTQLKGTITVNTGRGTKYLIEFSKM